MVKMVRVILPSKQILTADLGRIVIIVKVQGTTEMSARLTMIYARIAKVEDIGQ